MTSKKKTTHKICSVCLVLFLIFLLISSSSHMCVLQVNTIRLTSRVQDSTNSSSLCMFCCVSLQLLFLSPAYCRFIIALIGLNLVTLNRRTLEPFLLAPLNSMQTCLVLPCVVLTIVCFSFRRLSKLKALFSFDFTPQVNGAILSHGMYVCLSCNNVKLLACFVYVFFVFLCKEPGMGRATPTISFKSMVWIGSQSL